ncbi:MAG: mannose-6-phosphate isomerase [Bacteroidetes bacterium]|nr:mannose-6-phosphate isomerase [Bacteroidota bacterium]
MNELYPLKFKPRFLEKIWGGERMKTVLGMDFSPLPNCGEAWVLSGVPGSETRVRNGFLKGNELNELVEIYMEDLVGEATFERFGSEFPILVKFIDSNDYLSIQVHPDDALAARRGIGNGKSEMWYILDAAPGAEIISGFSRKTDAKTYLDFLEQKKLKDILNIEKPERGDVFNIPAGRIHALGPGILLAEIQQTSDTTYRVYDWDRVDEKGKSRELHKELALEAIDFDGPQSARTPYRRQLNKTISLVDTPHFTTRILNFDKPLRKDYSELDSFVIYVCVEGKTRFECASSADHLGKGETLLIPAVTQQIVLSPTEECTILEVFIS